MHMEVPLNLAIRFVDMLCENGIEALELKSTAELKGGNPKCNCSIMEQMSTFRV